MPTKYTIEDAPAQVNYTIEEAPSDGASQGTTGEGFWESLGHTFGIGKEEALAAKRDAEQHPVRSTIETLGGPAYQSIKGLYEEFMRSTGEMGEAVDAGIAGNPYAAAEHGMYAVPFVGAGIERGVEQLGPNEVINPAEVGTALGTAIQTAPALTEPVSRGITGPISRGLAARVAEFRPRTVEVGGEKIPVTVGEAEPESSAGRLQTRLKRSGSGSKSFEKAENAQQEAAKNVIKKTAQKASGQIGPLQAEPGAVVNDAATASFAQAAPLYESLDESLKTVPGTLTNVSKLVDTAIGRARKLGVVIDDEGGDISKIHPDKDGAIQWGGTKISKATQPERWAELVDQGIIDDSGNGTPMKAYRNVISQLKSMQRSSTDGATRFAIGKEINTLTNNMDAALKGSGLDEAWHEADRLWRQGHARIDVAKAITDATKGPRASITPDGMAEVPTEMQGPSLVKSLDKLLDDGTLEDAFTPDEAKNLRQSALILDRIQKTSTGTGYGESGSRSRAIAHILRGSPGPLIGGGIGAGVGLLTGHAMAGLEAGGFVGFIVQRIGEQGLIRVMTRLDGMDALESLEKAKTPAVADAAMKSILAIGATGAAIQGPKTQQLQKIADDARNGPSPQ
jgi:hypothetical protein